MAFFDKRFDVYLVFGGGAGRAPWAEPQWSLVAAALDPLLAGASAKAAVRSDQLASDPIRLNRPAGLGPASTVPRATDKSLLLRAQPPAEHGPSPR